MINEISTFILGAITTIVTGILSISIYDHMQHRVTLRRIRSARDPKLNDFFDVYEQVFANTERQSHEDFIRWLDDYEANRNNVRSKFESYYFVITIGKKAVGVMYFDYYKKSKYVFFGFIGIDKEATKGFSGRRGFVSRHIIPLIRRTIAQDHPSCEGLLFEIQHEIYAKDDPERRHRTGRMVLYKDYVKTLGLSIVELDVNYIHPRFLLDGEDDGYEQQMRLIFIPMQPLQQTRIPKEEALAMLRAVYLDWYGDTYLSVPEEHIRYQIYLNRLLMHYERELPNTVALRSL